jgi:hypothetical protein
MTIKYNRMIPAVIFACLLFIEDPVNAQTSGLTPAQSIHELVSVRRELGKHLHGPLTQDTLNKVNIDLQQMVDALRKEPSKNLHQSLIVLSSRERALVLRANAVTQRAKQYLNVSSGCADTVNSAMASVLLSAVEQMMHAKKNAGSKPAVIDAIETTNSHQPIFIIKHGEKLSSLTLLGVNFTDSQCANPSIMVTNGQGIKLKQQPVIERATPARIQLKWFNMGNLMPDQYVLHITPRRESFLFGCSLQTREQALGVLQVISTPKVTVSYTLTALYKMNNKSRKLQSEVIGTGVLGPLSHDGAISAVTISVPKTKDVVNYTLEAKSSYGGVSTMPVGPISQPADANITIGLPSGLTVTWNPALKLLSSKLRQNKCMKSLK